MRVWRRNVPADPAAGTDTIARPQPPPAALPPAEPSAPEQAVAPVSPAAAEPAAEPATVIEKPAEAPRSWFSRVLPEQPRAEPAPSPPAIPEPVPLAAEMPAPSA